MQMVVGRGSCTFRGCRCDNLLDFGNETHLENSTPLKFNVAPEKWWFGRRSFPIRKLAFKGLS